MDLIDDATFLTLRQLLNLTDAFFHIKGGIFFTEDQYVSVAFDDLKASDFDLSEDVSRLEIGNQEGVQGGIGLNLDLVYKLDFDLLESTFDGSVVTSVPYTRDGVSVYIHNPRIINFVETIMIFRLELNRIRC